MAPRCLTAPRAWQELVRTDMHCHDCGKNFVAQVDPSVDGNHVIECPHCGHEHCRVIEHGQVTGERFDSRVRRVDVDKRCVWRADSLPAVTSTAADFLRERWLQRVDVSL